MFFIKNFLIFNFIYLCSCGIFLLFKTITKKNFSDIKENQATVGLAIITIILTIPIEDVYKSIFIIILGFTGLILSLNKKLFSQLKTSIKNYFLTLLLFLFASIPLFINKSNTVIGYLISNDVINHLAMAGQDIGQNFLKESFINYPRGFHSLLNLVSFAFKENDLFYLFTPTLLSLYAISALGLKQIFNNSKIAFVAAIGVTYLSFVYAGFAGQILFQAFYYSLIGFLLNKKDPNWLVISLLLASSIISYGLGSILWLAPTALIIQFFNKYKFKEIMLLFFISMFFITFAIPKMFNFYRINKNVNLNEGNVQRFIPAYQLSGVIIGTDYRSSRNSKALSILFIFSFGLSTFISIKNKNKSMNTLIFIIYGNLLFFWILNGYYIWAKNISTLSPLTIGVLLEICVYLSKKNKLIIPALSIYSILIIICSYKTSLATPVWSDQKYLELKKINNLLKDDQSILFLDFFDAVRLAIPKKNLDTPFNQYLLGNTKFDKTKIVESTLDYDLLIINADVQDLNRINQNNDSEVLENINLILAKTHHPIYEGIHYVVLQKNSNESFSVPKLDKNYRSFIQNYEEKNEQIKEINFFLLKNCKYKINETNFDSYEDGIYSYELKGGNFSIKSKDNCFFMLLSETDKTENDTIDNKNIKFIRKLMNFEKLLISEKSKKEQISYIYEQNKQENMSLFIHPEKDKTCLRLFIPEEIKSIKFSFRPDVDEHPGILIESGNNKNLITPKNDLVINNLKNGLTDYCFESIQDDKSWLLISLI